MKELMRKVGLEGVSLDSLRHTNATELLRNGAPLAEVSRRLGHADQNITLAIYSHAIPTDSRAAAKIWDDALGDVIEVGKKAGALRTVAHGCTEAAREVSFVERKGG
ncbi:MAG: tyrosine-type recombinase/integrase [Bryobacteraceae bacterium]